MWNLEQTAQLYIRIKKTTMQIVQSINTTTNLFRKNQAEYVFMADFEIMLSVSARLEVNQKMATPPFSVAWVRYLKKTLVNPKKSQTSDI